MPALPTNIDTTYADSLTDASVAAHQQHHDVIHKVVNDLGFTTTLYAKPTGNNANDGLSWGTAKQTILGAYDALPVGGGRIYVAEGTMVGGEVANQGLWIADYQDSQYGALPAGWRQAKSLHLIGANGSPESFQSEPQAHVGAGDGWDVTKPAVWISGTARPIILENLAFQYPAMGMKLGIDSAGGEFNNTASIYMRNVTCNLNMFPGGGPVFHMGSIYWSYFDFITAGSNSAPYIPTAASITSGTIARYTLSINHIMEVGDTVDIRGMTPAGYNTFGNGDGAPRPITAKGSNWIEVDIGSSPAAATVFGTVRPVESKQRAIFYCPTNCTFDLNRAMFSGGGVMMEGPTTGFYSTMRISKILKEGNWGEWYDPPLFHVRDDLAGGAMIYIEDAESADSLLDGEVKVPPDRDYTDRVIVSNSQISLKGEVTVIGGQSGRLDGPPPMGLQRGKIYAENDAFRRNFAPSLVRFAGNLVPQDLSAPTPIAGTPSFSYGKRAPDGTLTAVQISALGQADTVHGYQLQYTALPQNLEVGDWMIAGVWLRAVSGGYGLGIQANGGSVHTDNYMTRSGGNTFALAPRSVGGHEWQWCWYAGKFTAVGTPATYWNYQLVIVNQSFYEDPVAEFWGPVLLYIPAADAVSDSEMREYAKHIGNIPSGVAGGVGNVALATGHKLVFPPDVNLYRPAANELKTDDALEAVGRVKSGGKVLAAGGIGVGNTAPAMAAGSITKKMEVFDAAGASVGFVPVYDRLWYPPDTSVLQIWVDFSDRSTLFQDTARATPVTADGQSIGSVLNKGSVAGWHLVRGGAAGTEMTYKENIYNHRSIARGASNVAPIDGFKTVGNYEFNWVHCHFIVCRLNGIPDANGDITLQMHGEGQLGVSTVNEYSYYRENGPTFGPISLGGDPSQLSIIILRYEGLAQITKVWHNGGYARAKNLAWMTGGGTPLILANGRWDLCEYLQYYTAAYPAQMPMTQVNEIGDYLAEKWGVTSWTEALDQVIGGPADLSASAGIATVPQRYLSRAVDLAAAGDIGTAGVVNP